MIAVTEQAKTTGVIGNLESQAREQIGNGPEWLRPTRFAAIDRFLELGFPTTKWEDWRFTRVTPIAETEFILPDTPPDLTLEQIQPFIVPGLKCINLVFEDGYFRPELSDTPELPAGVKIQQLHDSFDEPALREHLGKYASFEKEPFTALNMAFLGNGYFIEVPDGINVETPIHVLNIASSRCGRSPVMTHGRNLVVVGDNASVRIIEHYVSLCDDCVYLNNAVTEIAIGKDAEAAHYFIEEDSLKSYNVSALHAHISERANLDSHTVLLDGAIVRNLIHPVLAGENAHCLVNGLYVGEGTQHLDNFMRIEHKAPNCESHQYYNGILNDDSHGVFTGRIVVDRIAQGTDAKQTSANLLLSDDATINTMPQLEIYADDVKCTHGATIGQIDENSLFYLRSRGISKDAARALLVYAFAAETFQRMKLVDPIRDLLTQKLLSRLPEGEFLHSVL